MKIIHDGDGAYEDIMALSLLLLNADVVAVTVAYGESTTPVGALNMERICRTLKPLEKIPVAYGVNDPIDPHYATRFPTFINDEADHILKATDVLSVADSQVKHSAVELIYNTLISNSEKITIVATGPLTNIAQLVTKYPDCIKKIEQLVIMGGAVRVPGNISDIIRDTDNGVAEWNIYADRKAADVVFTTKNIPIMLVPIDITRQMPMTKAFYEGLCKEQLPALKLVKDMLTSLLKGMGEELFYGKLQFWDSLSAMITLNNSMAAFEELSITIDLSTGQTKIKAEQTAGIPLVRVAMKLLNPALAYDTFLNLMKTGSATVSDPDTRLHYRDNFFGTSSSTSIPKPNEAPHKLSLGSNTI
jgi:inosine-uridine nucleoside N-ribohydrolase